MRRATMTDTTRAAFAVWEERIAPVFDVSRLVHVVDAAEGHIAGESRVSLPTLDDAGPRCRTLVALGVESLVCGAISRPLLARVEAHDIEVVPFVAGELRPVIAAWLAGTLHDDRFAMPGCCGRARRRRRAGPGGQCLCPRCGQRASHEPGRPCQRRSCPNCGAPMIREP